MKIKTLKIYTRIICSICIILSLLFLMTFENENYEQMNLFFISIITLIISVSILMNTTSFVVFILKVRTTKHFSLLSTIKIPQVFIAIIIFLLIMQTSIVIISGITFPKESFEIISKIVSITSMFFVFSFVYTIIKYILVLNNNMNIHQNLILWLYDRLKKASINNLEKNRFINLCINFMKQGSIITKDMKKRLNKILKTKMYITRTLLLSLSLLTSFSIITPVLLLILMILKIKHVSFINSIVLTVICFLLMIFSIFCIKYTIKIYHNYKVLLMLEKLT